MRYAPLGRTGLAVSRLAFGAMTFSGGNKDIASVYKVGANLADELVGAALDAGVNLFDTADAYAGGESEALLGAALKARRSEVMIATKVGFRTGEPLTQSGLSRRHILWSVDQSLKRLGTDWIDLYIVHREDPHTPIEEMRAVARKHGASVAQVAMAWLLSKRAVTSVLIGSTKRSQLDDNLKAIGLKLAAEDLAELDSATALPPVYPNWFIDNAIDQPAAQALGVKA